MVVWNGTPRLADFLVSIESLGELPESASRDDLARIADGLVRSGQVNPVLVDEGGRIVARSFLVAAAKTLDWTHVAARLDAAEASLDRLEQTSLVDEVERSGFVEDLAALTVRVLSIDEANDATADPEHEWVGLPEFVAADDCLRVVVSCSDGDDRDALLDVLGIAVIRKGTRGTLSVWWPDRPRDDLSSLRFESGAA